MNKYFTISSLSYICLPEKNGQGKLCTPRGESTHNYIRESIILTEREARLGLLAPPLRVLVPLYNCPQPPHSPALGLMRKGS